MLVDAHLPTGARDRRNHVQRLAGAAEYQGD
jgi:hypothetical protein